MKGAERKTFFFLNSSRRKKYLNLTLLNIHTFFSYWFNPWNPKTEYINSKWQGKKKSNKNKSRILIWWSVANLFGIFFCSSFSSWFVWTVECFIYFPFQSTWSYFPPFVTINRWNAIFQHIDTLELIVKTGEKSWPMKKNRHSSQGKMNILIKLRKPHALRWESSLD